MSKITAKEQQEIEEMIRDEIAARVLKFSFNEYLAADAILKYLESIGYEAPEPKKPKKCEHRYPLVKYGEVRWCGYCGKWWPSND